MKKKRRTMEEIDQIVFRYQDGDQEAGEEILRLFGCHPDDEMHAYVGKFYKIIRYGRINFKDRDTRLFIYTFLEDPRIRENMRKFYQEGDTKGKAIKAIYKVQQICRVIPDEDLKQDLRWLLLRQAIRWKKKGKKKFFTGYLYNSYRYAVKNYIAAYFKAYEPLVHKYNEKRLLHLSEDLNGKEDDGMDLTETIFLRYPMLFEDDILGNSWVRGLTCGEEFRKLTPLQRLIVKLHYDEKVTDGEIAKKTGMHINTIFKHRKRAVKIIEETIEELRKEGYYDG